MSEAADSDKIRLDKWLWAARFFKARAQATEAVEGGKVHVNGARVKPARPVRVGDRLEIRRGEDVFVVIVRGLSDRRGPASTAQLLYEEIAESKAERERRHEERRLYRTLNPAPAQRPNKQQRRRIVRFKNEK